MTPTIITINISGENASASLPSGVKLTSGSERTYTAAFVWDSSWDGLTMSGVFIAAPASWPANPNSKNVLRRSLTLDANPEGIPEGTNGAQLIPAECLAVPGKRLYIGLSGTNEAGTTVKNSTVAYIGTIQEGADVDGPGDGDIPQSRYDKILAMVGDVSKLDTNDKTSLVAAINEVLAAGGGDVSDEAIAAAVDEYLAANPIGVDATLTKSGQAADAAVVGEKLEELSNVFLIRGTGGNSFAEITEAISAGKLVMLEKKNRLYYVGRSDTSSITFFPYISAESDYEDNYSYVVDSSDTWSSRATNIPFSTTEISEYSDDEHIPTAKAVYEYLAANLGVIENGTY